MASHGFRWCPYCGKPHDLAQRVCPQTGKPLEAQLHRPTPAGGFPALPAMHPTALTGRVLDGKYRMLGTIGAGGVGTAYEAENVLLRRRLAVKVVTKPGLGEASEELPR